MSDNKNQDQEEQAPVEPVAKATKKVVEKSEAESSLKKQLAALLAENALLKGQAKAPVTRMGAGSWKELNEEKPQNRTATFRMYRATTDDPIALIVDWKFLRNDYDELYRAYVKSIYKVTLLYEDGSQEEIELPLKTFSEIADRETVEIIEKNTKKMVKDDGSVLQAARDRSGRVLSRSVDGVIPGTSTGHRVPLRVTMDHTTCVVRRPSGQEFTVNANRLNA